VRKFPFHIMHIPPPIRAPARNPPFTRSEKPVTLLRKRSLQTVGPLAVDTPTIFDGATGAAATTIPNALVSCIWKSGSISSNVTFGDVRGSMHEPLLTGHFDWEGWNEWACI
jgi:hypothetical protein